MKGSSLIQLKLKLDYSHEVLSKVTSLKNILSKALTDGLYDRDFYMSTIRYVLMIETETKQMISLIEQEITKTGYVFNTPGVTKTRFETRI